MKKIIWIIFSIILVLIITGCGNKSGENLTLLRHYGQEKYNEMKVECKDERQIAVANELIKKAKEIMQFVGKPDDAESSNSIGALSKYYYFNNQVSKADVDVVLITTKQLNTEGYIWVKYSAKYYDHNNKMISGSDKIVSRWEIKNENGAWKVTDIDEIP